MFKLLKENLQHKKLFFAGGWLTVLGLTGGFVSYIFQFVIGRELGPADFALFNFVISCSLVIVSPFVAVNLLVARRISGYIGLGAQRKLKESYFMIFKFVTFWGFLIGLGVIFFGLFITEYFSLGWVELIILSALVILSIQAYLPQGYFQGRQYFSFLGGYGLVQVILKLILTIALIQLGYGLTGVFIAVIAAMLFCLLISNGYILYDLKVTERYDEDPTLGSSGREKNFAEIMPLIVASVSFALFSQFDIIMVKLFFEQKTAGVYVSASILAKTILYLPGGFALALYPIVAQRYAIGQTDNNNIVFLALGLTFIPCLFVSTLFALFPQQIMGLFFGKEYLEAGPVLKWFGFSLIPLAMVAILEHFLIAQRKILFAYIFICIAPLQMLLTYFFIKDVIYFVYSFGLFGLLNLVTGLVLLGIPSRK